jgi:glycosyltransferase involved in cell wall biosynthesis
VGSLVKRVLVIAYFFPPLANSGTQRLTKFVKWLPEFGWQPVVVAGRGAFDDLRDETLSRELDAALDVSRVPMLNEVLGNAVARLFGTRAGLAVNWRMRFALSRPDLYGAWRYTARRAGMALMQAQSFDAILATGFPWTALLVGRDLSVSTGVPFVADFRDVWTLDDVFLQGAITRRDRRLEQSVVRQASSVISVSSTMTDMMRELHPTEDAEKFQTVLNGYDPNDLSTLEPYPAPAEGKVRIVYTGVWRPAYGPHLLYEAIAALHRDEPETIRNLEVVTAGFPKGHAREMGIDRSVTELGQISHPLALGLMASAHALYAPVAPGVYHRLALPGKLYEYLGVGRPVFSTTAADGETAKLLGRVGGGRVLPSEKAAVRSLLTEICRAGELVVPPVSQSALSFFERRNQTKVLAELLDRTQVSTKRP